jgi:transposase InsO family protein
MARDNPCWGYDRIAGALCNLGISISDQTVGNMLKRNGLVPSPERRTGTTWAEFIRRHKDCLWATDFFTTEIWTACGLTTFYVLFFIQLSTRKIVLGGVTQHPRGEWMDQVARNVSGFGGPLATARYLIHDRDDKYAESFDAIMAAAGTQAVRLPPQSPNLNAFAERFVKSVKTECLDRMVIFGEGMLRHLLKEYLAHYHAERNHQGIGNAIPFPDERIDGSGAVAKSERLGGLLVFYHREAA